MEAGKLQPPSATANRIRYHGQRSRRRFHCRCRCLPCPTPIFHLRRTLHATTATTSFVGAATIFLSTGTCGDSSSPSFIGAFHHFFSVPKSPVQRRSATVHRCQRFFQRLHRRSSLLHASLTIFYECETKPLLGFFSLQCRYHWRP
ncbi:hypothetical protein LR48_Vigan11g129300 [Vigna angularis]|uniref:Uncharacterized protein n=1 Tax=Phaseolus angularis TaxID=3914 RepID=A0A0L9VU14_PHAAN|nr:hypothetical protein LR48_Vigan11g129300 [Vigna angularis]